MSRIFKTLLWHLLLLIMAAIIPSSSLADKGDVLWYAQKGTVMDGGAAVMGYGVIYIGSNDNKLYALYTDGTEKWAFETNGNIVSSPAVGADGTIYFGSEDGSLYAVDPGGKKKWEFAAGDKITSSPAIGPDGTIYFASENNSVYALDEEGSKKWQYRTGGSIVSSPALNDKNTLYAGSEDWYLYAINTEDGSLKWKYKTKGPIESSPAIGADGTIYFGSDDNNVYALEDTGEKASLKWKFETKDKVIPSPAVGDDNIIYVGSDDKYLYALKDGGVDKVSEEWKFQAGDKIESSPVIGSNRKIYFGCLDSYVYALHSDGEKSWSVKTGNTISPPVISNKGTLYIGTRGDGSPAFPGGRLYAIETGADSIAHDFPWPVSNHDVRRTGRNTPNKKPSANAGNEFSATSGQIVSLDGTGSTDPDYGIFSYSWKQTSGTSVKLTDSDTPTPSFTAPENAGDITFELTVTDNGGLTSTSGVKIDVEEDSSFCFINTMGKLK